MAEGAARGLTRRQAAAKRALDLTLGGAALALSAPITIAAIVAARRDTGASGIFAQERIGRGGKPVTVHKIRTMAVTEVPGTTVTTADDPRITPLGRRLRAWKVDELPQLVDVVRGRMSLVGPRPDVAGWADRLEGDDAVILTVRPGITGPASLAYRHEEDLLAGAADPVTYNRDVIWPDKVAINRRYVENWTLRSDLACLVDTVRSVFTRADGGADRA